MDLSRLIEDSALKYQLEPEFLAAVVLQESSGNPLASRPESAFYQRYLEGKPLSDFVPSDVPEEWERILRAWSFGLCQIMGQVAREMGFKNPRLFALMDPAINLELGARKLRRHLNEFGHLPRKEMYRSALLRWNGGGDPLYPDKVFSHIEKRRVLALLPKGA